MKSSSPVFGAMTDGVSALADAPFTRDCGARALDLTNVDASIALVAGYSVVFAEDATDSTVLGLDVSTAALPPASGAAEEPGCITYPAGGGASVLLAEDLTLHARVLSGTAVLRVARKSP